jgi:hypothetical protein
MSNIVYILTNETMPGLVKVGRTDTSVEQRMAELYKSGVPVPFECFHASRVEDARDVEGRIHRAFEKYRVNKNREFFEIEPESILEILEMVEVEDVTPSTYIVETEDDRLAVEKLEKKADRFSFSMVDIPVGATLTFSKNELVTSVVVENNKILFQGEERSLSQAALEALRQEGYNWISAQGAAFWRYNGKTLKQIREEKENE